MSVVCEPEQLRVLQTVIDRVWHSVGPTYGISKDEVEKTVVELAQDSNIDIEQLVRTALSTLLVAVAPRNNRTGAQSFVVFLR